MTLALRYAVRSDVGLLREGNEDSAYAGPHLLAVADGMGGHAAGEVASAATITTLAALDAEHPAADLVNALADAVASANMRLQELVVSDPSVEGMGTTLTALLWSDGQAALCHIGDSRAYLLRSGQFYQITHDHTLVQSLVDEGKITEDDVATHPHRSLLLRALDGRTMADPDLSTHETMAGDRYLLCSDGLSGVVTEQTLHQTLGSVWDPEKAALQLIELAIRGGGPDNITCIVADVLDTQTTALPPTRVPVLAGAASHGSPTDHGAGRRPYDDDEDDYAQQHEGKRRWPIVTMLLVLLVLLIGGGLYAGWQYVQGQYYVGVQDGNVAIFRGINQNLAGISLSSPITRTGLPINQVVASNQAMIRQTIPASSLADARTLVGQIQSEVDICHQKWQALVQWQIAENRYKAEVAAYRARRSRVAPKDNPGAQPPTPDAAGCAPASAFGIPASALPGGQPTPAPSATVTPTRPAATATTKAAA